MKTKGYALICILVGVWAGSYFFAPGRERSLTPYRAEASSTSPPSIEFVNSLGGAFHTMALEGHFAYIGAGTSLTILDLTDPASPTQISRLPLQNLVQAIVVQDGIAYMANSLGGLIIADVQDPAHPVLLTTYDTLGIVLEVLVIGQIAYVVAGGEALQVLDVLDPAHPVQIGTFPLENYPTVIEWKMDVLYLGGGGGPLRVLDVSDPTQPLLIEQHEDIQAYDFTLAGNYGYFTGMLTSDLLILDITDPHHLISVSSNEWFWQSGEQIEVNETHAFIYYYDWVGKESLTIVDIRDPASPERIHTHMGIHRIAAMVLQGETLYLCQYGQLTILDIQDLFNLVITGHASALSVGGAMHVEGNIAYMSAYNGLGIFDISNPVSPTLIGQFVTPLSWGYDLAYQAGQVYLANGDQGLMIIDVSQPLSPTLVGTYIGNYSDVNIRRVKIQGTTAYILNYATLEILDLSDPFRPTLQGTYSGLWDFVLDEELIYGHTVDEVQIIDVSNLISPTQISTYVLDASSSCIHCLALFDHYLYVVASFGNGLHILDVSNPAQPFLVGKIPLYSSEIQVHGTMLYAMAYQPNSAQTFHLLDIRIPQSPRLRGTYSLPYPFWELEMVGNALYVSDGAGGLQILQIHPELFPPSIYLPLLQIP